MLRATGNWLKKMSNREDWEIDVILDDFINTDEEQRDPILQVTIIIFNFQISSIHKSNIKYKKCILLAYTIIC